MFDEKLIGTMVLAMLFVLFSIVLWIFIIVEYDRQVTYEKYNTTYLKH